MSQDILGPSAQADRLKWFKAEAIQDDFLINDVLGNSQP
jgi:hypothetical protein